MSYICSIDIGGTFTDCVVVAENGNIAIGKAESSPKDFSHGFFEALEWAAKELGISLSELLKNTTNLMHGSTVATNAMTTRSGGKVGLITTRGHKDVLPMMRAFGRIAGLSAQQMLDLSSARKPEAIIPKSLIEEVSERIDCKGKVIVELNEEEVDKAITTLLQKNVEAISICFLWSFLNPTHEKTVKELVYEKAPDIFVSCSNELIPKWGEYERTAAVAINSYIGPVVSSYVNAIEKRANASGYKNPLLIMQCTGGVMRAQEAKVSPILMLESGPVGGVVGSKYLGEALGYKNIITTDMGGTTFDVGLIYDGEAIGSSTSIVDQYQFYIPTIDVKSIGSGGGSIVWADKISGSIKVGPKSAGADPGPVCYNKGGKNPTVTDANIVLGYLNPNYFLGGRVKLDKEAAEKSFKQIGQEVGMDFIEAAAGAIRIVNFQMADLIRKVTIEKGFDPREFVVFTYGGAGPTHGAVFAKELGAEIMVAPLGDICSVWSAYGIAASDVIHIFEHGEIMSSPFNLGEINRNYDQLEKALFSQLLSEGVAKEGIVITRYAELRYKTQVHEVEVDIPDGILRENAIEEIVERFEEKYELLYGKGSGFREAGVEIVTMKCKGVGRLHKPLIKVKDPETKDVEMSQVKSRRNVYWPEKGDFTNTDIYRSLSLTVGTNFEGPAIVELPETTIVIRPEQLGRVDRFGNFVIDL